MPKKYREVRRELEVAGWQILRQRGSHEIWAHPGRSERIPDLPGVVAIGTTRDEVANGIREALGAYADDLRGRGLHLPEPHHASETVAVAA